ncbi:hypothetical protein [Streptomyces sp. NPDC058623]|uniref:hypothetical protein n=1 Tax=Streptomyces sp. NPDC058623 TaxID=3346563 RepID=UPI00365741B6
MISEPELEGEWTSDRPAESAGALAPPPREGGGGPGRSWLWALGGVVLASAVWAGVLVVQDRFPSAPPLAYRHSEDLCEEAELKAVSGFAGPLEEQGPRRHSESPAMDWSYCDFATTNDEAEGRTAYYGQVLVELHKRTDPEAEFGAGPPITSLNWPVTGEVQEVPGLGERALFFRNVESPRIQVLDGGAVFTVNLQWFSPAGDPGRDEDTVTAALIEDTRALMVRLRK